MPPEIISTAGLAHSCTSCAHSPNFSRQTAFGDTSNLLDARRVPKSGARSSAMCMCLTLGALFGRAKLQKEHNLGHGTIHAFQTTCDSPGAEHLATKSPQHRAQGLT